MFHCNILPCILFNVFYFKLNTLFLFVHCYVSLQSVKLLINEHDDEVDPNICDLFQGKHPQYSGGIGVGVSF